LLPPILIRFSSAAALAYAAYAMCRAPVLPLYARELGAGPELIGLIAGASTLTGVALKLPAGALSDALGRRRVLLLAAAVFALMPLTYPAAQSTLALLLIRFAHGSGSALFGPTAAASLSDLAPVDTRGRWLSTYSAIQGAGQAAGPVLGGWVLARYGFASTFVTAAVLGVTAWALLSRQLPAQAIRRPVVARHVVSAMRSVAGDRRIVLTSVAQASQFMLHGLLTAFLPLYAVEQIGLPPEQAGLLFGTQMATTILARPVFGRVSDRAGRHHMIAIGLIVCAAGVAALPACQTFSTLLLATTVYGIGLGITTSSTAALITDLADRSRYGAAHGFFGTVYDMGDALGPIVGGVLVARIGFAATFQAGAATVLVLAIVFTIAAARWRS
jgi:MFS transporter, DHA1 family, multidrug resistance protein